MSLPTPKNARKRVSIPLNYWNDRQKYRYEIFRDHIALARKIAHKFCRNLNEYDEIEQIALLAMHEAIDSFNPNKGAIFATHATVKIKSDLLHHRRDNGPIPRSWMEKYKRVRKARDSMAAAGRSMTLQSVATKLGIPSTEWDQIEIAIQTPDAVSIDDRFDMASPPQDCEGDEHTLLRKALFKLSVSDRKILDAYAIGAYDGDGLQAALTALKTAYLEIEDDR